MNLTKGTGNRTTGTLKGRVGVVAWFPAGGSPARSFVKGGENAF